MKRFSSGVQLFPQRYIPGIGGVCCILTVGCAQSSTLIIMRDNGKQIKFAPRNQSSTVLSDPSEFIGLALSGDIDKFREFISVYPDAVNLKEKEHGNVALHVASSKGNLSMASLLMSRGANVNIQDIFGNSPLHYAVDKKRKDMVEMLIKCGADVNLKDFRGNTPLHAACVNNDIDIVRILLLHNADPEASDLSAVKPIQKTTQAPIKALIERKIQLNHGGSEDQAAKIVTMMSFGIGLGVGLGMAMAKQQQFQSEQQLLQQLAMANSKKRPGAGGGAAGGGMFGSFIQSGSENASNTGSQQLQNAGALVLHQSKRHQPPPQSERKLL